MKYIVIFLMFLSLSEAKDIHTFIEALNKTAKDNKKVVLSLSKENSINNIKYLVSPNIYMYTTDYEYFFSGTPIIDEQLVGESSNKPSVFEVFIFNLNAYMHLLKSKTPLLTDEERIKRLNRLEFVQYKVLSDMINYSKTIKQLKFSVSYMYALFNNFDVTNQQSCKIIKNHKNSTIYKFISLLNEEYVEGPTTDNNISTEKMREVFPLIKKDDLNLKNIQFFNNKIYELVKNENTIFLNRIKNSSDVDFSFLKNYIKELENRERELNNQKEKLQKNKASLLDLQIFYSSYYSNIINLSSAKLFKDLLFIYNYEKSLKKECISK